MPKAWVVDLWTKDALVDGQRIAPTSSELRKIKSLPDEFRTPRFGKGNRWRVTWTDPATDKPKTKSYATKSEADELKAQLEDDIRAGRYINPEHGDTRFGDLAKIWLESKRKIKDSTYRRYSRDLDRWVLPKWAPVPIASIQRQQIDNWVGELQAGTAPLSDEAKRITKGGLSPNSIRGIVAVAFGAPLRYATSEGWLYENPLKNVELPEDDDTEEMNFLTHEEVNQLASAVRKFNTPEKDPKPDDGLVDYLLVLFLAYTGLRINEALALDWRDVDLKKRRVRVRKTWTVDKEGKRVLGSPKSWERRSAPLTDFLIPLLENMQSPGWVFKAARGGPIDDGNWRTRVWSKVIPEIGLDGFTIHGLRHTAVSLAIAANADVKVIQKMVGHKSASITLDVYGHLFPDRLDEVANALTEHRRRALIGAVPSLPNHYQADSGT